MRATVTGDVQQGVNRAKKAVDKHVTDLIGKLVGVGEETAKDAIYGGLEMAQHSIHKWHKGTAGQIATSMPRHRALSIEEGRRTGEKIPLLQVARWSQGDRYLTARKYAELPWKEKEEIRAVQSQFMSRTIQGKRFMHKAAEEIKKQAPGQVQVTAQGIEKDSAKSGGG